MTPVWAVVPAAGVGRRFGGPRPKQYLEAAGAPLIAHALDALLAHPEVIGAMVAIAADDGDWPGWTSRAGKPVHVCVGGAERGDSVLAALEALEARGVVDALVLVHDAARPNLAADDVDRLITAAKSHGDGAILAAPARDTLKRADPDGCIATTESRDGLWRALTPQAFDLARLAEALRAARRDGVRPTDEAMAMERTGARPRLVEGREDNLKVTTPADLAVVDILISRRQGKTPR